MQPMPVGETGVWQAQGGKAGGGSPGLHGPPDLIRGQEGWGYRAASAAGFTLARREGLAPSGGKRDSRLLLKLRA